LVKGYEFFGFRFVLPSGVAPRGFAPALPAGEFSRPNPLGSRKQDFPTYGQQPVKDPTARQSREFFQQSRSERPFSNVRIRILASPRRRIIYGARARRSNSEPVTAVVSKIDSKNTKKQKRKKIIPE